MTIVAAEGDQHERVFKKHMEGILKLIDDHTKSYAKKQKETGSTVDSRLKMQLIHLKWISKRTKVNQ